MHLSRFSPDGHHFISFMACSPRSARETTRFLYVGRNYALDAPDEAFNRFSLTIREQDRVIVENQRPEELPLDLAEELHLRGPDAAALEYRRLLTEMGLTGPSIA
jgi:hypothetical protein